MEKQVLQITSGRGPAECCWAVAQVLQAMQAEAGTKGLDLQVLAAEKGGEAGTLVSASLQVAGAGAQAFARSWTGTIQWIGQSPFRKYHKRKNWFVGVNSVAIAAESSRLNDSEIKYQAIRSGGPGGQHVNKVSSAVRATHLPTGLSVLVSDSRSQHHNKQVARERLHRLWQDRQLLRRQAREQDQWHHHNSLERGNPVRVYEGRKFRRKR